MSEKQTGIFRQLCTTFPPATIRKWEAMVLAWNANPKAPNPYAESKNGMHTLVCTYYPYSRDLHQDQLFKMFVLN